MATGPNQDVPAPVWVWGLPLLPVTFAEALDRVEALIRERQPAYFITANLHYAMLTAQDARLRSLNDGAAFILADGMPLVWASRWRPRRLPGRVAGSDLVPALCERAAARGFRVYFLGGGPGVGDEAARRMVQRYPGLQIVGVEVPPFRALSPEEEAALIGRIRAARPDLLFVAFGQPKGELWLEKHREALGVPACAQIGATLDFLADRVPRAPRWMQRTGLEWVYRLYREPTRLTSRYFRNALFALKMLALDLFWRQRK